MVENSSSIVHRPWSIFEGVMAMKNKNQLSFYLFGAPHLKRGDDVIEIPRRKAVALLAYLAVSGQIHTRPALAALLWPESERTSALASLRRVLALLKQLLGEEALIITRTTLGFNAPGPVWVDVVAFEDSLASGLPDPQTADLYQGEFMAGFVLRNAPAFDAWQVAQAQRLHQAYAGLLAALARLHRQQGDLEAALTYARRQVDLDPLHEPAQQRLLGLYQAAGHSAAAVRHYQAFCQQMVEEMGVLPDWTLEKEEGRGKKEESGGPGDWLAFLQEREAWLKDGRQITALQEIEAELDQVRAAWQGAVKRGDAAWITAALSPLFLFYELKGHYQPGLADLSLALTVWPDGDMAYFTAKEVGLNGRLHLTQGLLLNRTNRCVEAVTALQSGLARLRQADQLMPHLQALALGGQGQVAWRQGDLNQAETYLRQSWALWQSIGDRFHQAQTLSCLASVVCHRGNQAQARRLDRASLALYEQIETPLGIGVGLNNLSHWAELAGEHATAEQYLHRSLDASRAASAWWLTAVTLSNLAHIAALQKKSPQAATYLQESLTLRQTYELPGQKAVHSSLAQLAWY
jgi:DNA-binding SARP family transcriptional activator